MIRKALVISVLFLLLSACAIHSERGTLAELENITIDIADAEVDGGLEKAMQSYRKFLDESPESELTPEAIRRLADLKIENEYGVLADGDGLPVQRGSTASITENDTRAGAAAAPVASRPVSTIDTASRKPGDADPVLPDQESDREFERRATQRQELPPTDVGSVLAAGMAAGSDLKNAGAEEAITLYKTLLEKYPMYERNDQVLYQLSRAYEETGQVDEAMNVMNRLVSEFPASRYTDEVQFRRGEYYFTRKKYLDAEEAYGEALKYGVSSVYYERALYKKGWTFYKEELYEMALHQFFKLLDQKVKDGYDFENVGDDIENKRIDDTFRVTSLALNNLGGSDAVRDYFRSYGARSYEDIVYRHLAEFYFNKRRFSDAANTYDAFVGSNPFHEKSPNFSMRIIEIYMEGGFPRLVVEAKKGFVSRYGLTQDYWRHFSYEDRPDVVTFLKKNLMDLANHYHAMYQNEKFKKERPENFSEASRWYRQYLDTFPSDEHAPAINYQLADLLMENKDYKSAAHEYERTAYDYAVHSQSRKAGYAAIYAYREHLKRAVPAQLKRVRQEITRSSLRLVDTFPDHEKATLVLGAVTEDLFAMRDYNLAIKTGRRLIEDYPEAEEKIKRGAWLVVAHSSYETGKYKKAELAYTETLSLMSGETDERAKLIDNLAASIYKQGEQAREREDYKEAVRHFLRIAETAPTSTISASAEYDAAAILIQIMELREAINILTSFREKWPGHELQRDITKKIAYAYKELGDHRDAAIEYERVARESTEESLTREAMYTAAELYEKADDTKSALRLYEQYARKYPDPLEMALETYYKIAMIHKSDKDLESYRGALRHIINAERDAGTESTERTRYLAAQASLVIIAPEYEEYIAISLVKPFKKSLARKQESMKALVKRYTQLADYKVADVTAASTYHIAEIYYNFSRSLMESERPGRLSPLELEEFNFMLEEQAFPFEEKSINIHEKNVARLATGIYSPWIDLSIEKLANLLPARYGKPEESINVVTKLASYVYVLPRLNRGEASTGYVTNLVKFRYPLQKHKDVQQKDDPYADIYVQAEASAETGRVSGKGTDDETPEEGAPDGKVQGDESKAVNGDIPTSGADLPREAPEVMPGGKDPGMTGDARRTVESLETEKTDERVEATRESASVEGGAG